MKKTFLPFLLAGVSLTTTLGVVTAFADNDDLNIPQVVTPSMVAPVTENTLTISTNNLTAIKARGSMLIKQRTNSLTSLSGQISSSNLTVDQKATITASIATQISALNLLGGNIASSTLASSTKDLVKSIFTNFRIYAVYIPQIRLEKRIDDLINYAAKVTMNFAKIQVNIDAAKASGKDVTLWQANLDTAKALVTADLTKLNALMTTVQGFKPADYPTTSKTEITAANASLKVIARDFNSVVKSSRNPYPKKMMNASTTNSTTTGIVASTTISGTVTH